MANFSHITSVERGELAGAWQAHRIESPPGLGGTQAEKLSY